MKRFMSALRFLIAPGLVAAVFLTTNPSFVFASSDSHDGEQAVVHFGLTFAMLALVLMAGKLGNIVERFGQPAVIAELFAGIVLAAAGYFGFSLIDDIRGNDIIAFAASLGALLLLFSIGLESNIKEMRQVGLRAAGVAAVGVVLPFVLGAFVLGPLFYSDASTNAHLFLGAALVATSVGIVASVFRSLGINRTRAAQTVLGAAVIDDVLGLIVLAVVSALASGESVTMTGIIVIVAKSFGFLGGAVIIGQRLAPVMSRLLKTVHTGIGMKIGLALAFALVFGYFAELFGLEPIIGAFAAGLILDAVHFDSFADPDVVHDLRQLEFADKQDRERVLRVINKHKHSHVEDLINIIGLVFIPIFFVYTGLQIDFGSLLQPQLYVIAVVISLLAITAKFVSGVCAEGSWTEKALVGVSMVPRGEVGLIFAATGRSLGVLSDELFSVIILVVIITTFIAPPAIKVLAEKLGKIKAA